MDKFYFYSDDESFNDYITYTEKDIAEVNKNGITMKDGYIIDFSKCADEFEKMHPGSSKKCVAERSAPVFIFYTSPKPTMVKFLQRNRLIRLIFPTSTWKRCYALQKQINHFGYRTYDTT